MLNILDRTAIFTTLASLKADENPVFGAMTPQHMIEHLALVVQLSNGKKPEKLYFAAEKAERFKMYVCYTDNELPIGFKAPILPIDELLPLQHANLDEAIDTLKTELHDFDTYFLQHPTATPTNPSMGELNYKEWVTFHSKHFTHHFKQFSLIESTKSIQV